MDPIVLNPPSFGLPKEKLAPHAVARWAREAPNAIALQKIDGPSFTYRELLREHQRWAAAFRRAGISPGDHVASFMPNDLDSIHIWMGLAWLGAIEVPLNPALVGELLTHCLTISDATSIVVSEAFLDRLEAIGPLPKLKTVIVIDAQRVSKPGYRSRADFLDGVEPAEGLAGPIYREISGLMFTSGTTGRSKAVRVPWTMVYHFWSFVPADAVAPGEGVHVSYPLFHNSGRTAFNGVMERGGRYVLREKFSGTHFWGEVRQYDCKLACVVGPMTAFLFAQPERPDDADNPLRGIAGGPLIPEIEAFKKRFGLEFCTAYGMTETGGILASPGWAHGPWQSCGRPRDDYPRAEVRVVNEFDEPVGPGVVGELVVRTAEPWSLNAGYYNDPVKTAESWRNGWFHTGDAFRYDEDGWFYLVDRMKDAIRRRGENISSFEVESVAKNYPGVVECAAIAVPAKLGEDEVMICVQTDHPERFSPEDFVKWLEPRLPKFMLPRYVEAMKEFPRNTSTMRIKKYELRERGVTPDTWDREKPR